MYITKSPRIWPGFLWGALCLWGIYGTLSTANLDMPLFFRLVYLIGVIIGSHRVIRFIRRFKMSRRIYREQYDEMMRFRVARKHIVQRLAQICTLASESSHQFHDIVSGNEFIVTRYGRSPEDSTFLIQASTDVDFNIRTSYCFHPLELAVSLEVNTSSEHRSRIRGLRNELSALRVPVGLRYASAEDLEQLEEQIASAGCVE